MRGYPITIERAGGQYIGTLPDWPECNPVGDSVEDVVADARRSIWEMAAARTEDGEGIPVSREVESGHAVHVSMLDWVAGTIR